MINTKLEINGTEYTDSKSIKINRSIGEFNTTSNFKIMFDNPEGRRNSFSLNESVIIYADKDVAATTKIFSGIIEDINYKGVGTKETLIISGRDNGVILRDVLVESRIFVDTEVSEIVTSLITQNLSGQITTTNVNVTTTTPAKITLVNISLFDALRQLAELSSFTFYVDEDDDLHFEEKDSISSGLTFDNTNTTRAEFRVSDAEIFNNVKIVGNRQLTGANEVFTKGTDNTGSVYVLDSKPHTAVVTLSGATNTILQPGGVLNIDDPATKDVKYLVNFQAQEIILASGTTAGDNIQATGSVVIIDYQRSTPLISIRRDSASISDYGPKFKTIIDTNIRDINEASEKAASVLAEHKDARTNGIILIKGIIDVTPGDTTIVNFPFESINNQTYKILEAEYNFNSKNNINDDVLMLILNKKIGDFTDTTKEIILRLRALEGALTDANITNLEAATDKIGAIGSSLCISRSIGSAFYFHTEGPGGRHDVLNSPTSLLGDMRTGSIVHTIA